MISVFLLTVCFLFCIIYLLESFCGGYMKNKYIKKNYDVYVNVRGGKVVNIGDVHKEILSIMDEVDRICRKYNITYGLLGGSALGVVNYGGFIPWDDDIDIFILRSDWDKFIEALDKELGDDFYFHCYEKDKRYNVLIPQMKIRKKNTYVEEENVLLDNRCDGNGIFVDVVTYGDINNNKVIDEVFRSIIKLFMIPMVIIDNLGINPRILKWCVIRIEQFYNRISKGSNLMSQPIIIPWEKFMKEPVFEKCDVLPVKEYEFEGRKYYSYNNIEKVLKSWYGNNCLKKWDDKNKIWIETLPVDKRIPKHIKDVSVKGDSSIYIRDKRKFDISLRINFWALLLMIIFFVVDLGMVSLFMMIIWFISFVGIYKYKR